MDEVSPYFKSIKKYYEEEMEEMYTRKDYLRENPDWQTPHLFPWEQDYYDRQMDIIKKTAAEEKKIATKEALKQGEIKGEIKGEIIGEIKTYKVMYKKGLISDDLYNIEIKKLENQLKQFEKQ